MKTNHKRGGKAVYSKLAIAGEPRSIVFILTETQKQAGERESFTGEKGRLPVCPEGGCGPGEAGAELTGSGVSYVLG